MCAMSGLNIQSLPPCGRGKSPSRFTFHTSLKKRAAFTLAEVLITLGIIGVVAAMTMPALISNYKYMVLENQLKAAYSDLNKAAKLFQMHNDMSMSEYAAINNSKNALKEFSKEFTSIIKTSDLIYSSTDEDGNTVGARPWHWKSISGSSAGGTVSACDVSGFFWDTQGRVISFDDAPVLGENGPKIRGRLFCFYVYNRRLCYSMGAGT